jgi:hypothetical protein
MTGCTGVCGVCFDTKDQNSEIIYVYNMSQPVVHGYVYSIKETPQIIIFGDDVLSAALSLQNFSGDGFVRSAHVGLLSSSLMENVHNHTRPVDINYQKRILGLIKHELGTSYLESISAGIPITIGISQFKGPLKINLVSGADIQNRWAGTAVILPNAEATLGIWDQKNKNKPLFELTFPLFQKRIEMEDTDFNNPPVLPEFINQ